MVVGSIPTLGVSFVLTTYDTMYWLVCKLVQYEPGTRYLDSPPCEDHPSQSSGSGLGVNPSKKKILCCSDTAGDATTIFVWTKKDDLKDIKNVKFRGCNTLEEKQSKMIAYAFEKAYDLAISRLASNVSQNPGFETPLGFFRRWT